ncbi:MAG: phosphoribosylpyrophosphate synthetase [Deltaproteobacteria bacterium]|nr:phosphoribosylpyrophosphate synthetase [Deltaproteobacteria bacterium]
MQDLRLFCGNANQKLTRDVAAYLGIEVGRADVGTFSDGECSVEIGENVRGKDCFVVQSTCGNANIHLMELLIMIDALKRASARRITAVMPYYGYARQDRKVKPRVPITAKLVADLIATAGADRVLCMDLHAGQVQGFFNIPVDNLYATPLLLSAIEKDVPGDVMIISPDAGGVERARAFAKLLGVNLAIIDKRREVANVAKVMNIIGNVENKTCVIVDDMVDTAGTLCEASKALLDSGANSVYAAITHPVLSGPALKRISESVIEKLIVTDTIPLRPEAADHEKLNVVSIARMIGEAIRRINNEESVSGLF